MLSILFIAFPEVNHGKDQAKGIVGTEQAEEEPDPDRRDPDHHLHRSRCPSRVFRLLRLPVLAEQRTGSGSSSRRRYGELNEAAKNVIDFVVVSWYGLILVAAVQSMERGQRCCV